MNMLETQCAMILQSFLSSTCGQVLRTNDPIKARATLYRVRKLLGDSELASLHIRVSPDDSEHELWLVKRSAMPDLSLTAGGDI
jgi:hypothetical protein